VLIPSCCCSFDRSSWVLAKKMIISFSQLLVLTSSVMHSDEFFIKFIFFLSSFDQVLYYTSSHEKKMNIIKKKIKNKNHMSRSYPFHATCCSSIYYGYRLLPPIDSRVIFPATCISSSYKTASHQAVWGTWRGRVRWRRYPVWHPKNSITTNQLAT
jgi:hypothetical protein